MELIRRHLVLIKKYPSYCRLAALLALVPALFLGCASLSSRRDVIASVNGESVTRADLSYVLEVAHRRDDASAGNISISDYVDKLTGDVLIIQEAREMGLDNDPGMKKSLDVYILTESVGKLYKEEILDKVAFTEDELLNTYKELYEMCVLDVIRTSSEDEARKALDDLNAGKDFSETALAYSDRVQDKKDKEDNGVRVTISWRGISNTPTLKKTIAGMKPGEVSGIVKEEKTGAFYILKLVEKKDPPETDMEHLRKKVETVLRGDKERERSDKYLAELRKKADVEVKEDVLALIDLKEPKNNEKFKSDERMLARVGENILTVRDYISMLEDARPADKKEEFLGIWINIKLVDKEALRRNYYKKDRDLRDKTRRYKDQLLKGAFIDKVIMPRIKVDEEEANRYYSEHKEKFIGPDQYKYQQITVKDMEAAEEILGQLKSGVDFAWIAKDKSRDSARLAGGHAGWKSSREMPAGLKDAIEKLKPGELSPVFEINSEYSIVKLLDTKKGEILSFDKVKERVMNLVYAEQYYKVWNDYTSKLKEKADIRINEKAVRLMEERLKRKVDEKES